MTVAVDTLGALIGYLRGLTTVSALAGARIYGAELPATEAAHMPRACVVLRHAGQGFGSWGMRRTGVGSQRFDVRCYGATPREAMLLSGVVTAAMKGLVRHADGATVLFDAAHTGGPFSLLEPDGLEWPFALTSYNVLTNEEVL